MEPPRHCAYNTTRESFLAQELTAGEFTFAMLEAFLPGFQPKSGDGLWLLPFRGIPGKAVRVPLDLIYLDANCCVLDIVESFPAFFVSASSPPAASVLVLPAHSIFASHTERGDRLLLCPIEELNWRLQQLPPVEAISHPAHAKPAPFHPAPSACQLDAPGRSNQLLIEPAAKPASQPKSWLKRLLNPDPPDNRFSNRRPAPGLAAYFFTGGSPQAHSIRDISPTGLYIVTAERWYPGTLVRLTLTKTDAAEPSVERSISVHAVAVRWGNDGVGLQFVLQDPRKSRGGAGSASEGVDSKQLAEFLDRLTASFPDKIAS